MPESVVTTETCIVLGSKRLYGQTLREVTGAAAGFRCVPLAAVLRDDVVEEGRENILVEACIGVVRVVSGSEPKWLALARRNTLKCRT